MCLRTAKNIAQTWPLIDLCYLNISQTLPILDHCVHERIAEV